MFLKIQDICKQMGTEIFKSEEKMTEKIKPKIANPPLENGQNIGVFYSNKQECKFALSMNYKKFGTPCKMYFLISIIVNYR